MKEVLRTGDYVRIDHVPGSPWQGMQGRVRDVLERTDHHDSFFEYMVELDCGCRWFLGEHLTRIVPTKWVRFFRNEAVDRWKLDPDKASILNGDRRQLVDLLCAYHDFAIRRAESEVDQFCHSLENQIRQAVEVRPERLAVKEKRTAA